MSERLPGLPSPPPPEPPVEAASIVPIRGTPDGVEAFWLRRDRRLSVAGGFYAFPGGQVDPDDAWIPVDGAEGLMAARRAAAARELFEETGLLLGAGAEQLGAQKLGSMRRALLEKEKTFKQLLHEHGLKLRADDFREAGRWITPPFMPRRFDAYFFLVEVPYGASAEYWPGEHSDGGWIRPADAIRQWDEGHALLHPPALYAFRVLADFSTAEDAAAKMRRPPDCSEFVATRIEFQRGIHIFPVETPTLPPATHTNAYLLGTGELLLVDPGSADSGECERLFSFVEALAREGARLKAIILTHHHADHVGGVMAARNRLGAPIWCHERTASRLPSAADRLLQDGEEIHMAGSPAMRFTVLHTPGHAKGHLCFVEKRSKAAIVGDMVAGVGTILIDPPEGDMAVYLQQLRRLRDLPVGTLYPAHGPPIADGPAKLTEYLLHREERERKVLQVMAKEGGELLQIARLAYDDLAEPLLPIAERSTLAILNKLIAEGRVYARGDRYRIAKG
jgi:glyoxylase-like metal-dependent hydrolase (beta-lactamase superfamily II)/8-oxo-dGTP pyrophosphatase MutT (NUDIX family)